MSDTTAPGMATPETPVTRDPVVGKAVAFLLRSTARKPLTSAEAKQKLADRDHDKATVEAAVAEAVRQGILDDAAFADAWVADRGVKRGYGRARLERELRRRKVPDHLIDTALDQLDQVDQRGAATELARKRAQSMPADLEPAKVANRLVGMLLRRGYDSELAHDVARKVTALDRDWD